MSINIEFINKGIEISDGETSFRVCCYPFQIDTFPKKWKGYKRYTFNTDTYRRVSKDSREFYSAFKGEEGIYYTFQLAINSTKIREYLETVLTLLDKSNYTKAEKINILSNWCRVFNNCYVENRKLLLLAKINVVDMEQNLNNVTAYCDNIRSKQYPAYEALKKEINFHTYMEHKDKPYFNRCIKLFNEQEKIKNQLETTFTEWKQTMPECLKKFTGVSLHLNDYENSLYNYLCKCYDIDIIIARINKLYLQEQEPLKPINFKQVNSYKDLLDIIQKLREEEEKLKNKEEEKRFVHNQTKLLIPYENTEYEVLIPASYADCVKYGEQLHNCLGRYEWDNYLADGYRVAFVVKNKCNNKLVACVDLTTKTLNIKQALAPCNHEIYDRNLKDFINTYVDLIKSHNNKN